MFSDSIKKTITIKKLKIYRRYGGDIDDWVRMGSKREKDTMNDADWYLIDNLIQEFILVEKGHASVEFAENLRAKIDLNCENEKTIAYLERISAKKL